MEVLNEVELEAGSKETLIRPAKEMDKDTLGLIRMLKETKAIGS